MLMICRNESWGLTDMNYMEFNLEYEESNSKLQAFRMAVNQEKKPMKFILKRNKLTVSF